VNCSPSLQTICVSHDGSEFVLEGGVSNNEYLSSPTPKPPLALFEGWRYTFQLTNDGDFNQHPFILTSDQNGGCFDNCGFPQVGFVQQEGGGAAANGVILANQPGAEIYFTANLTSDIGKTLFYQCDHHPNMGNQILIVNGTTYNVTNTTTINNPNTTNQTVSSNTTEIYSSSTGLAGGTTGIGTGANGGSSGIYASTGGNFGGSSTGTTSTNRPPNAGLMKSSVNWIVGGLVTLTAAITVNLL